MSVAYTPCGGCGAKKPTDRCISCFHDFGGGSSTPTYPTLADRTTAVDPRTGRAIGDHGTAMQAVDFALDRLDVERDTFLKCWREGDLDEWPEFYAWLKEKDRGA